MLVPIESHATIVNNTNLPVHPISHGFWVTAQLRSDYGLWQGSGCD